MSILYTSTKIMSYLYTIKRAAEELGVSTKTLRRWEESGFFVPAREPNTAVRLYWPLEVKYWKEFLDLNRKLNELPKKMHLVAKKLNESLVMKPLAPGERLPLLDVTQIGEVIDEEEKLDKEFKMLMGYFLEFPEKMKRAVLQIETEEQKK